MTPFLRRWYQGKDVRVDPTQPDTIGGMGNLHKYRKEFHWSAIGARVLASFYLRNWQWLWGLVISAIAIYVSVLALK